MMSTPLEIQLALQGGGAKLSALLAAMEPVQALHRKKSIKVTRVAGTSAGAIVAALFAADVDLIKVRERLKRFDAKHWKRVFPESKLSAMVNLSRGKPVWGDDFFRKELKYFFDEKNIQKVEQTSERSGVKLALLATNLREGRAETYFDGELIPKILDSCALPYFFRVWSRDQNPVIVDGGICENLPSDILMMNEEELGPVYGISFPQADGLSPTSVFTFTWALLDTAIKHSVNRAKDVLGSDKVLPIQTKITTFNFPFAFSDDSDDEYKRIRKDSEEFFANVVATAPQKKRRKTVPRAEWSLQNRSMASLGRIFESHYMDTKVKYSEMSLEVVANSLADPTQDDYVIHKTVFRTLDEPVYCLGFSVNADHDLVLEETVFEVFKKTDLTSVDTTYLPSIAGMEGSSEPARKRLLVFFLPRLEPNSQEYVVALKTTVKDFVKPLREEKPDKLWITPYLTEETVGKVSIVLQVPKVFDDVKMFQPEDLGRPMNRGELSTFNDLNTFKKYGWIATDVKLSSLPKDCRFVVDVVPVQS